MRILFLGEPLANAQHWMNALRKEEGVEVLNWHLPNGKASYRIFQWLLALFTIKRVTRRYKPDLVIGYRTTSYGFLAAMSGIKPCVIAAQGESDVWPPLHWTAGFKTILVKYAIKKADLIHAWGPHIARTLLDYGASEAQLLVLPRGVNTALFTLPIQKPRGITRIVTTRGLFPEYHHDFILMALSIIKSQGYAFHYTIVGEGILREELELLCEKLQLTEVVEFVGKINNEALPPTLQASNIYIAMPETEGISASLFEAMACGCFPIVPDLPANRLYIEDGKNGALIPFKNQEILVKTLQKALTDIVWRENASDFNRKLVVEKADLVHNMNLFVNRYRKLIESECAA